MKEEVIECPDCGETKFQLLAAGQSDGRIPDARCVHCHRIITTQEITEIAKRLGRDIQARF